MLIRFLARVDGHDVGDEAEVSDAKAAGYLKLGVAAPADEVPAEAVVVTDPQSVDGEPSLTPGDDDDAGLDD